MAKPELGIKRQCLSCAAKFYDLNRDPILCPKCGTPFQVLQRRADVPTKDEDEAGAESAAGPEMVSLDAVDADPTKVTAEDDIDLGDDLGDDDDAFLETEEEEGDDDVAALIDGDIEDDEES